MGKENKIYAAYGSNMNLPQMRHRCPYATIIGNAELTGYQLLFRGHAGGAVATVEPKEGGTVPILLWEITPRDEEELDRYEGWPRFYRKETVTVSYNGKLVDVMAYIMNDGYPLGKPGKQYFNAITEGYLTAGIDTATLNEAVRLTETEAM
ncbi:MAG: gamma-glutamylcyclotransferase [Defluviitaleaceae bacterium]|nr:gamma-glutamylcyclotransferase [Defluviitaleaceae bacterium]